MHSPTDEHIDRKRATEVWPVRVYLASLSLQEVAGAVRSFQLDRSSPDISRYVLIRDGLRKHRISPERLLFIRKQLGLTEAAESASVYALVGLPTKLGQIDLKGSVLTSLLQSRPFRFFPRPVPLDQESSRPARKPPSGISLACPRTRSIRTSSACAPPSS